MRGDGVHADPSRVRLLTKDGGLVACKTLPPFFVPPTVLVWGSRVFVLADAPLGGGTADYVEAFAYVFPN